MLRLRCPLVSSGSQRVGWRTTVLPLAAGTSDATPTGRHLQFQSGTMSSITQLKRIRSAYERDGYVVVRNVVSRELMQEAEQHVHATIARHPGLSFAKLHQIPLYLEDPFYLRLVRQEPLLDIAAESLGPNLALFATGYIIKSPGSSMEVLWHQDGSYWPLDPMEVCTLWVAITESKVFNGCMRVIPGTQHMDLQALRERRDRESLLGTSMDESLVDESKAVDLELEPGDVSMHHPNIIHGSNANKSPTHWRLNLVIRIIAASTKVTDPNWPGVFHLRGEPREDVNRYLPEPV
ncbi:MAG: phytanoyl-CoA dioxygenase family protein [Opitutaceae bacterium]